MHQLKKMESSDIEDLTVNVDEVNDIFRSSYSKHGSSYLSNIERKIRNDKQLDKNSQLKECLRNIHERVKKSSKVNIVYELERFRLSPETIHKVSNICMEVGKAKVKRESSDEGNEYEDDFEDYEEDFENDDTVETKVDSNNSRGIGYGNNNGKDSNLRPKINTAEPIVPHMKSNKAYNQGIPPRNAVSRHKARSWISKGKWKLGELIGTGSFGEVYQGLNDEGSYFAVKKMRMGNAKETENLSAEIELMEGLCHPNIVQYLGFKVDQEEGVVYIFQEWVPGGSIANMLTKFGPFTIGMIKNYTRQILTGLKYLHAHNIVHRDIKGGNVLIDDHGIVKLADFGASIKMKFNETQETTTIKGTPYFMAPEVLSENKYGRRGDIWAVGCTVIQMLTGHPPWKEKNLQSIIQLHLLLSTHEGIPPIDKEIPDQLHDFLEKCFAKDPKKRPMAEQLLDDPFLVSDCDLSESTGSAGSDIREEIERARQSYNFRNDSDLAAFDKPYSRSGNRNREVKEDKVDSPGVFIAPEYTPSPGNPFARRSVPHNPFVKNSSSSNDNSPYESNNPQQQDRRNQRHSEGDIQKRPAAGFNPYQRKGHSMHQSSMQDETDITPRQNHSKSPTKEPFPAAAAANKDRRPNGSAQSTRSNHSRPSSQVSRREYDAKGEDSDSESDVYERKSNDYKRTESYDEYRPERETRSRESRDRDRDHLRSRERERDRYGRDRVEEDVDEDGEDDEWRCLGCGTKNINEDFCRQCALRKGATGERGANARIFKVGYNN